MTPRMAYDQARRESSMYRQGRGWIVSTYDTRVACYRLSGEMHYCAARCDLAGWRRERAADLLAGYDGMAAAGREGVPVTAPLAYLILASDDVDEARTGAVAAVWALQAAHIRDVAESLPEAKAAQQRAARVAERPMSILAVRLVDDEETGAEL